MTSCDALTWSKRASLTSRTSRPASPDRHGPGLALWLGPAVVLVTHGRDGATVLTAEGETVVPATRAAVIDTIGAGDAFGAAWLAAG